MIIAQTRLGSVLKGEAVSLTRTFLVILSASRIENSLWLTKWLGDYPGYGDVILTNSNNIAILLRIEEIYCFGRRAKCARRIFVSLQRTPISQICKEDIWPEGVPWRYSVGKDVSGAEKTEYLDGCQHGPTSTNTSVSGMLDKPNSSYTVHEACDGDGAWGIHIFEVWTLVKWVIQVAWIAGIMLKSMRIAYICPSLRDPFLVIIFIVSITLNYMGGLMLCAWSFLALAFFYPISNLWCNKEFSWKVSLCISFLQ